MILDPIDYDFHYLAHTIRAQIQGFKPLTSAQYQRMIFAFHVEQQAREQIVWSPDISYPVQIPREQLVWIS